MEVIRVKNLTKDYLIYTRRGQRLKELFGLGRSSHHEVKRALYDISFSVSQGECIGVIGENGSGKTTLLKILAGSTRPTAGDVNLKGRISSILDPTTGFDPDFSGRENVFAKAALMGLSEKEAESIYSDVLTFSELGDRIHHPLRTYSTGMLMRLGFAVTIHVPFDILLVDEVLYVGDYLFQRKCANAIRAFKELGKTIVVTSHALSDVSTFCDRLLLLSEGKLIMEGGTEALIKYYVEDCERREGSIAQAMLGDNRLKRCMETVEGATITKVQIENRSGLKIKEIRTGEYLKIVIGFLCSRPLKNPCLRVQFLRNDGLLVMGTNTYRVDMDIGSIEGRYEASLIFDEFNLLAGDYYVNVGIWPDEWKSFASRTPYDVHEFQHVLRVISHRRDGGGLVRSLGKWSVLPEKF